ncbi:MAG: hypothetical protein J6J16_00070 [Lachnospiraceae bacterium]|nr:hypothetical protein [Lachnospiraceae bacterium]
MDNMKKAFIVSLICGVLMVVAFLMPFTSATKDYKDDIDRYEDTVADEELNLTYGDMKHLTLVEYARIYFVHRDMFRDEAEGIVYLVVISAIALFTLLTVINVLRKKPIGAIVFDIIAFAGISLMRWDFLDRGIVPSSSYNWGIGIYLYYIAMVALFVSCIWLGKEKKKSKVLEQ